MNSDRNTKRVGFIGGGNMTLAIAGGLLGSGFAPERLQVAEPLEEQRARLGQALPGVCIGADNKALAENVECLVLATKPQVLAAVCRDLADAVQARRPLVMSIAAGVRTDAIADWLGTTLPIIRVMPNQPALLRLSASALFATAQANSAERELASKIMQAVGKVVWVDEESDLDAVTAISGSGPAYFYLLIDMLIATACEFGLDATIARTLAVQTAVGAAAIAADSEVSMDDLIARVRSPGGTTAAALDSLEHQQLRTVFAAALRAARDRAKAMADEAKQ